MTEEQLQNEIQDLNLCLRSTEANLDFLNTMQEINADTIAHLKRENKKLRETNADLMRSISV